MFGNTKAFSGFAVNDLEKAKEFYGGVLGIRTEDEGVGFILHIAGGNNVFVYPKPDHTPATYTILNFQVSDIDQAVDTLISKGVVMEHYDSDELATDEKGIMRGAAKQMGPNIAWFRDPAGNVLSVIED